jgi:hypothetical protein
MKPLRRAAHGLFLLLAGTLATSGGAVAADLPQLLKTVEGTAEGEIVQAHGSAGLLALRDRLERSFGLAALSDPGPGGACPALGFPAESEDSVVRTEFLDRSGAYYQLGVEAVLNGHLEIAKWGFARAAALSGACGAYLSNLGFALNEEAQYAPAVQVLERARQLDPSDSSIYVNLAFSYQNLQRYDEAIGTLLVAIALQPDLKAYQVMLADLKKLRKGTPKTLQGKIAEVQPSGPAPASEADKVQGLEAALALLQGHEQAGTPAASGALLPAPPSGGATAPTGAPPLGAPTPRAGTGDAACGYFREQGALLVSVGDEFAAKSGYSPSGDAIDKFIQAGTSGKQHSKKVLKRADSGGYENTGELVRDFATIGSLETAMVFYGLAGEMQDMCGDLRPSAENQKLLEDARREREEWEKKYYEDIDKEKFSRPVCRSGPKYSVCVSKGSAGTRQIEVGGSFWEIEIKIHPTNLDRCGLKISLGPDLLHKEGLAGMASGKLQLRTYHEWKVGRGVSSGTELIAEGEVGKMITTKDKVSHSLIKYSPENRVGSVKKP